MPDYLNLKAGEQQVMADTQAEGRRWHERQCDDCEPCGWAETRNWETIPTIVCLCGSTRFWKAFQHANYEETMAGKIVLSVGFFAHLPETVHGEKLACTAKQKRALDELHMRKIDLADEVLILNVGGYIGESTRNELNYAEEQGKAVRFLEPPEEQV